MRPFLKWAGGKYHVLKHILAVLPPGKRLIEPFAGSGAVFLNTDYPNYLVADNNLDLINLYQQLQTEGPAFIAFCQQFFTPQNNTREKYYELRELFNASKESRLKSALFVYLNRHGFNGLCRYNSSGKYNVPFGRYQNLCLPEEGMHYFYQKMQTAIFQHADFTDVLQQARPGDVIYCDPPYVPLSLTANFTEYSPHLFGEDQQLKLASMAEDLAVRGIPVVISNHNTAFTRKVYHQAKIIRFNVRRSISRDVANRNEVKELLAVFGG